MALPLYNLARGGAGLAGAQRPPFSFEGVTARVFPLKANMYRLSSFCDAYLNLGALHGVHRFQPAVPIVYVMVLDYGRMAIQQANLGWISQKEVTFTFPLEWYRKQGKRWIFHDWAVVSPFIFVDDNTSLTTGREVYGWPKVEAWLDPGLDPWTTNPRAEELKLRLSTMMFPRVYAGERQEPRVLLEVKYGPAPALFQAPVDFTRSESFVGNPLRAFQSGLRAWQDLVDMSLRLPALGYRNDTDPLSWIARLGRGASYLDPFATRIATHQITLKQFRDAEFPDRACYQALVDSDMVLRCLNAGGMLGDPYLRRLDTSGGYRLEIHRYTSQPIIECLGLEVDDEVEIEGHGMATLRPLAPFWLDMDLDYGKGRVLDECIESHGNEGDEEKAGAEIDRPELIHSASAHLFNTARGAATQAIVGPFGFPDATLRVLPLLADGDRLKAFCSAYLDNGHYAFEPFGGYVYAVATNYEEMSSETNNVGFWAERELEFLVPVKWYEKGSDGGRELLSVALVPAFAFVDSSTAAITGREVNGRPAITARIESPADAWMERSGPARRGDHLRLITEIIPALHLGQRSEHRQLLGVTGVELLAQYDYSGWRHVGEDWGAILHRDHQRRVERHRESGESFADLKTLALEILANGRPVNFVTLKQFRDAENPNRACYQSLVHYQRTIHRIFDLREIEDDVHLVLHTYPTLPIAEILGLQPKLTRTEDGLVKQYFQPLRPFWMRVGLEESLGIDRSFRGPSGDWEKDRRHEEFLLRREPASKLHRSLVEWIDDEPILMGINHPTRRQNLRRAVREWQPSEPGAERGLPPAAAAAAIEGIDPQSVIESMLSVEWQHWGTPRWFLEKRREHKRRQRDQKTDEPQYADGEKLSDTRPGKGQKPELCVRVDSVGTEARTIFPLERRTADGQWYSLLIEPPEPDAEPAPSPRRRRKGKA